MEDKAPQRCVVFGFLGTVLDARVRPSRGRLWRPTLALFRQPHFTVDKLVLWHHPRDLALAERVRRDALALAPEAVVELSPLRLDDPWDFEQVYGALHDFARGYAFDPRRERYLVHLTTGTHVAQICLFLLTESRHLPASLVQTSPPRDATSPGAATIIDLDLSKYDRLGARFEGERRALVSALKGGIETRNARFNALVERLERVASASAAPVLLTGPTGAGKSQLARRVYELKRARRLVEGELAELNCATLRGDTAMAALFGHTRGAFTGAAGERAGLLRRAHKGVLFLDELGELGLDEQAMLLHALEHKSFYPVGSDREVHSDFQLVAGTNRDLRGLVRAGRFREDLLARVDVWTFELPSLRERPEDLEPNLEHELERAGRALGVRVTLAREAREAYLRFARAPEASWSANFRDLSASVLRMATLAQGGRITRAQVDEEARLLRARWSASSAASAGVSPSAAAVARERTSEQEREGADAEAAGGDEARAASDRALVRAALGAKRARELDRFDEAQLAAVLRVCRGARSLSEAGRALFARSLARRRSVNDADRLRKYLARFELAFASVGARAVGEGDAGRE